MRISEATAFALATRLLEEYGAPRDHAALQARVLVTAEMKGHPPHGLYRLPRLVERIERGVIDPEAKGKQRWRAVRVDFDSKNDAKEAPLHVLHAAEHGRKVKAARWSVLREQADGPATELVAKADRSWPDSFLLRDHQCGLPFSPPLPALAFTHGQKLHWVTVEDAEAKIVARVWEVGESLRRVMVLPVALGSPKW